MLFHVLLQLCSNGNVSHNSRLNCTQLYCRPSASLVTPLAVNNFGWSNEKAIEFLGWMMASMSLLSVFCFGSIGPLSKRIDERLMLIFAGVIPMIIGRLIMMPMGKDPPPFAGSYEYCGVEGNYMISACHSFPQYCDLSLDPPGPPEKYGCKLCWCLDIRQMTLVQFMIGFAISTVGYPFCIAIIGSLYSKTLGGRKQGLFMGLLTGSGSFARVLGPIAFTRVYQEWGTYITFTMLVVLLAMSLILFLATFKRFPKSKKDDISDPLRPARPLHHVQAADAMPAGIMDAAGM